MRISPCQSLSDPPTSNQCTVTNQFHHLASEPLLTASMLPMPVASCWAGLGRCVTACVAHGERGLGTGALSAPCPRCRWSTWTGGPRCWPRPRCAGSSSPASSSDTSAPASLGPAAAAASRRVKESVLSDWAAARGGRYL